jgi:hypothetical protein
MAKPKKTTQLQTDFWEDTINLRNCTLGFECKQDWYRLLETKDENVKYCKQCEKSVYMIHNDTDLMDANRGNRLEILLKAGQVTFRIWPVPCVVRPFPRKLYLVTPNFFP